MADQRPYYMIDGPYTIMALCREDIRRITFVVFNPLMAFHIHIPLPMDDAVVAEVGQAPVPEDAKDKTGDTNHDLVTDNK